MLIQDGPYLAKRSDPIDLPATVGVSGVVIAPSVTVSTSGLAFDSGATPGTTNPPLITIVQTITPSASATQSAAGAVSKPISVSTVIGSCIGAFIFVSALIIFGIWFYRRYSSSLRKQALSRSSLKLRLQSSQQRGRPWNKLEDEGDKWEGMNQTKEVDQVVPMEKLTMFKRAASVRTAYTQKSVDDQPMTYPQSFAPFDANLVRTLSDHTIVPQSQSSEVANSIKVPNLSNLSSSSNSLREPLSSGLSMAIPTPEATVHHSHKWESAEVVQYEGQSSEVVASHVQDKEKKSMHNPFFGSQEYSRARSDAPPDQELPNAKGKERMHSISSSLISSDPFELAAQLPRPTISHLQASDSSTSTQSKSRALQTLMGALELSEDEVRDRLRVASMHPSEVSQYATPFDEEFVNSKPH